MRLLRPWHLLLVALALFVPIQAGALSGGGPAGLGVSASLGECGVSESGIVCRIDASWNGIEGAYRYTAAVTLADGSVQEMGEVGYGSGGGSTSLWVPYAGDGIYTVTVTAWGADKHGRAKKVSVDTGKAQLQERAAEPATSPKQPQAGDGSGPSGDSQHAGQEAPAGQSPPPQEPAKPPSVPETPAPEPEPDSEEPAEPAPKPAGEQPTATEKAQQEADSAAAGPAL